MFSIVLARQGQTMEQGTLVRWIKQEGDSLAVGEELYEVETEKTVIPIEVTRPGTLLRTLVEPGDVVPVGTLLALAADPGESVSESQLAAALRSPGDVSDALNAASASGSVDAKASPRVAPPKIIAMPRARLLANELGVDLARVEGTGDGGMILPDDVTRAASSAADTSQAGPRVSRRIPVSPVGRSIITALERGWSVPQFTQGILVNATGLQRRRRAHESSVSYMDLFIDAIVGAARTVPNVLARLQEKEIVYFDSIDISIATATEHGLLIPVLRDADSEPMEARGKTWRGIVERARRGQMSAQEMSGGLIALSNIGTRGLDYGTPLLPFGHSAIVFIGELAKRAIAVGDSVQVAPSVHVSITYDHRVIDGVLGAQFTSALKDALLADG